LSAAAIFATRIIQEAIHDHTNHISKNIAAARAYESATCFFAKMNDETVARKLISEYFRLNCYNETTNIGDNIAGLQAISTSGMRAVYPSATLNSQDEWTTHVGRTLNRLKLASHSSAVGFDDGKADFKLRRIFATSASGRRLKTREFEVDVAWQYAMEPKGVLACLTCHCFCSDDRRLRASGVNRYRLRKQKDGQMLICYVEHLKT
jgi:hypothetical protein